MSDALQHECGVALLRLRRTPAHYREKYGPLPYGCRKLALLLEKQHNRGQDGAGMACLKLQAPPGTPYYRLERSNAATPLGDLINRIDLADPAWDGELYLGHLRYGTYGNDSLSACHPVLRESSCRNRTMMLAGNFNLTNTRVVFDKLVKSGHHPMNKQDSTLLLHALGHELEKQLVSHPGNDHIPDPATLFRNAASDWDGAFHLCGVFGNGDAFAFRDAAGIRPAFYYIDDEIVAVASERPAIQTAFGLPVQAVRELPPGHLLWIGSDGEVRLEKVLEPREERRCVFERIYFSRGNDADIQRERRTLGKLLAPRLLETVENDFEHTVFSYIPNTAELSFLGMVEELHHRSAGADVRFAKIAIKDAKFRTFITGEAARSGLGMHVYDVTYGVVTPGVDNLVVIDDSIVRGTTLRNAILPILDRLEPKRIIVVSSAPQVRYPDCYGIDMGSFGELAAFRGAVALLEKRGEMERLAEIVARARYNLTLPDRQMVNTVRELYALFTPEELSAAIAELLRPPTLQARFEVVYQTEAALAEACPDHRGDWYFSGNYPTPGGNRVANRALVNYIDNIKERAYSI